MADQISVLFLNSNGEGVATRVSVSNGMTLGEFIAAHAGHGVRFEDYQVSVNRDIEERSYVLQDGDRVSLLPSKVTGA